MSTVDDEIHHPDLLDAAAHLCRTDCAVYCKVTRVANEEQRHYFVHHIPSWLRKGQFVVVRGFVSVFYTPNAVT
jgi:hypothetical protein